MKNAELKMFFFKHVRVLTSYLSSIISYDTSYFKVKKAISKK